ncbi:MAG: hypothetical protein ABIH65_00755 [Nanoarchaeota archaeon]
MFNNLKNWMLGITAVSMLFLASCKDNTPVEPPTPVNNPPTSIHSVNPNKGELPLNVRFKVLGEDADGVQDIKKYVLSINGPSYNTKIEKQNPIDTTITLRNKGIYFSKGIVIDSGNLSDTASASVSVSEPPIQPQPKVSQTAELENLVNIKYSVVFENLASLKLDVLKNNQQILSKTITQKNYSEVFSYKTNTDITKGEYDFVARWKTTAGNDTSNMVRASVPNYNPDADFSGLNADLNEGSEINLNLEEILDSADNNPEDNPVPLRNATSLDGKVQTIINNNQLTIKALDENTGNYNIEVKFGSETGGINTKNIAGNIFDLVRVAGQVQDTRTKAGSSAKINIYRGIVSDSSFLEQISTDAFGNFNFKLTEPVSTNLIMRARLEKGANPADNYTRTISIPNRDTFGVLLRAFPYSDSLSANAISREDFKMFFREIVGPLLEKPDISMLNIEIANEYIPFDAIFTPQKQDAIENIIKNPQGLQRVTQGRQLNVQKDYQVSTRHYLTDSIGHVLANSIESEWIIFFPQKIPGGNAFRNICRISNVTCRGYIFVGNSFIYESLTNHELLHMFLGAGHTHTIPNTKTLMNISEGYGRKTPGVADVELGKIVYEETYAPGESMNNILGLGFRESFHNKIGKVVKDLRWK